MLQGIYHKMSQYVYIYIQRKLHSLVVTDANKDFYYQIGANKYNTFC